MSWEEPVVSAFLLHVSALLVYIPACAFGVSIHKAWLFATIFAPLIQFATVCCHDRGAHLMFEVCGTNGVAMSVNRRQFTLRRCRRVFPDA